MKETIFISHATPEDNAFSRWLGSKLELAGYEVGHDLARFKGGVSGAKEPRREVNK